MIYVVSDPHFYHLAMIKKRGFQDFPEYHKFYVEQWNSVVSKRDVVYILGDLTMEKPHYAILNRLNGIKHVVLGNHDVVKKSHLEELMKHCNKVLGSKKLSVNGKNVWLTHIPVHPIEFEYRIDYNIHGHLHDIEIDDSRYVLVCPEKIGYKPILIEKLIK